MISIDHPKLQKSLEGLESLEEILLTCVTCLIPTRTLILRENIFFLGNVTSSAGDLHLLLNSM